MIWLWLDKLYKVTYWFTLYLWDFYFGDEDILNILKDFSLTSKKWTSVLQSSGPFFLLIMFDTLYIIDSVIKVNTKAQVKSSGYCRTMCSFRFSLKKKKKTSIHLSSPILKCIFHVLKIKVNFYEYVNWTCQITFERKLGCLLECSQIFIYKLNAN